MRHLIFVVYATLSLVLTSVQVSAEEKGNDIIRQFGQLISLQSLVLKEGRELQVNLPRGYSKKGISYPVFYLLDGDRHFQHAVLAAEFLAEGGVMPKAIIVAITNNTGQRMRDAYEKPDQFLSFIRTEVIPKIDKRYKTTGRNLLFGHSAMGLVALKSLLNAGDDFAHLIVSSPAMDAASAEIAGSLKLSLKQQKQEKTVFISVGDKNREGRGFFEGASMLSRAFSENATDKTRWYKAHLAGQNHTTAAYLSMVEGLRFSFADFQPPAIPGYQAFVSSGGIQGLTSFFEKRGEKYLTKKQVPAEMLTALAFTFYGEGKLPEAVELLKSNVSDYQDTTRIWGALAFILEQKGQINDAHVAYQKALAALVKHQPESANRHYYQRKIEQLKLSE